MNCQKCGKPAKFLRAEDYEQDMKVCRRYFCRKHGNFWSLECWVPDGIVQGLASEDVLANLGEPEVLGSRKPA